MAYVKVISSLNERSLHIGKLWTGWGTLERVIILECKYQTSQTQFVWFFFSDILKSSVMM